MFQMHEVPPDCLAKWQTILDSLSRTFDVPAALLMRVWPEQIEVLVSSFGEDNPYEVHEKADLGTGLYCETVMATRDQLNVSNALDDPAWKDNPDVKLNMINYLGVPLVWPDDTIFGTMCVLDARTREYPESYQALLWKLKRLIENDFRLIRHGERDALSPEQREALELEINDLVRNIRQSSPI
ncbi:MAG: GAF domain-containing protein [Zoogloeaceae bacterium]|nr:GAF domain-containing protein [Zoogloeaceae bacterium]